jgi:hypothetical protein
MKGRTPLLVLLLGGGLPFLIFGRLGLPSASTAEKAPSPVDFDQEVRPVLSRCLACHGPSKARGGLRLDSFDGATAALDSGNRAIVPGKPDESEMLRRVLSKDKGERMPPSGEPLTAGQIESLRRWIADGAKWTAHWAYRPLAKPALPILPEAGPAKWARNPIDHFIHAEMARHKLSPAPEADRRTLLRRVTFDLLGLPPTPKEIDAFLADKSPDAYEKIVDRLLASPHYGERWARHWMDIVHFAETHGHDQDRPRENAWPYRDYLIRSFNDDKSYSRFLMEQIAGDVLYSDDPWATVATGFLAAGPWDESSLRDIREDTIDREIGRYLDRDDIVTTVMGTFASTTVGCARCHDHKFDPVSQADYYGLQAVFAATDKANRPYDPDPRVLLRRRELIHQQGRLAKQKETQDRALLAPALQAEVAVWEKETVRLGAVWEVIDPAEFTSAEGATLTKLPDGSVFSSGKLPPKDTYTITAHTKAKGITAIRLEVLTDDRLPHKGPGRQDNGNLHLNEFAVTASPRVEAAKAKPLAWRSARADFDQAGWTIAHAIDGNESTAWGIYPKVGEPHHAIFTLKEPLTLDGDTTLTFTLKQIHGGGHLVGRLRLSITTAARPEEMATVPSVIAAILKVTPKERSEKQRSELAAYYLERKLERELATLPRQQLIYCGTSVFAPDGQFRPAEKTRVTHVLNRGDVSKPGRVATPAALSCLPGLEGRFRLTDADAEGARRAALARWLADAKNGLAWRSIANRVWQYHFGRGLVDTPNDFGRMGAAPTHPALLDWLAVTLQEKNGSLKALHRLIVTSATYRQSTRHHDAFAAIDADNRYLWRMNRRRLDAESIHDAVLLISGKLDRTMGGPSVKQFIQTPGVHVTPKVDYDSFDPDAPANYRRSVYRFLFRTLPDPFMESLDCPDGSQTTPLRSASVTALQALTMLNDKFMVRQSEHIADRAAHVGKDPEQQVAEAYRLILGRSPTAKEARAVGAYAARRGMANACRVLLNSNEFVFVD